MNVEIAPANEQVRLPSKGPLSLHQQALFVFWVSAVSLAMFRKLLVVFKIPTLFGSWTATCGEQ